MESLQGKRLLMLEGNALAKNIIDKAHELGIFVIIANWYSVEDAPAKAFADKAYTVNIFDIPAMMKIIREEKVDGLFTAYTDSHLHIYAKLCKEAGLPCFTSEELCDVMVKKNVFKKYCILAGVPVIEEYDAEELLKDADYLASVEYPIIVKPVDNSGARGISVCYESSTVAKAIQRGLDNSASKTVVVEKYLRGDYCLADFMIQNGVVHFCDSCDKPVNNDDAGNVNLPGAYIYPSAHNSLIKKTLCDAVQKFVDIIGYKNGLLCLELINEKGKIYVIEAQFRYGAKYQEVFLNQEYGLDQIEILFRHALTGDIRQCEIGSKVNRDFQNSYALMNILLGKGTIAEIQAHDQVAEFPHVDAYIPMKHVGDKIEPDGSMIQRFGKVALSAGTKRELYNAMLYFQENLQVKEVSGYNMVIASIDNDFISRKQKEETHCG